MLAFMTHIVIQRQLRDMQQTANLIGNKSIIQEARKLIKRRIIDFIRLSNQYDIVKRMTLIRSTNVICFWNEHEIKEKKSTRTHTYRYIESV